MSVVLTLKALIIWSIDSMITKASLHKKLKFGKWVVVVSYLFLVMTTLLRECSCLFSKDVF